jgi:hypothetical protein
VKGDKAMARLEPLGIDALDDEIRQLCEEAEIVELVAHATLYIGFGRFNEIVGVDPASR